MDTPARSAQTQFFVFSFSLFIFFVCPSFAKASEGFGLNFNPKG